MSVKKDQERTSCCSKKLELIGDILCHLEHNGLNILFPWLAIKVIIKVWLAPSRYHYQKLENYGNNLCFNAR